MFKLRPYQERGVEDAKNFLLNSKKHSGIVVAPTGAGKSLLVANIAMLVDTPVLVLQPSKELLVQNYEKYVSYGLEASIYSASLNQKEIGHVTFATPNSVKSATSQFKKLGVKLMIVDECHIGASKENTISALKESIGVDKVIGLTATPVVLRTTFIGGSVLKMMNRTRDVFFQDIVHVTQIQELTSQGFWSKIEYKVWSTETKMLVAKGNEGFTEESVRIYFEKNGLHDRIKKGCDYAFERGFKHILVFVPLVQEALVLEKQIPDSVAIYGDMPAKDRDKAIADFKSGKIKVALNVNVLGTGFDFPELDCIIHARPTNSVNLFYQHVGRIVRIHPNKELSLLLDFSGNVEKFGKVEDFTFEKEKNGWGMFSLKYDKKTNNSKKVELTGHAKIAKYMAGASNDIPDTSYIIPIGQHKGKYLHQVKKAI